MYSSRIPGSINAPRKDVARRRCRRHDVSSRRLSSRRCCVLAVVLSFTGVPNPATVSALSFGYAVAVRRAIVPGGVLEKQMQSSGRAVRRSRVGQIRQAALIVVRSSNTAVWAMDARKGGRGFRESLGTLSSHGLEGWRDWKDLDAEAEKNICEQILEHRRVQNLQVELERRGGRPVSVQEWAVAAGHPSSHQLLEALQEGRKAERTLVICHQALVRSVAARYGSVSKSLSYGDLVQEGNIGLLQAVGLFDPSKGCRFSSYAVYHMKAAILRAIADKDRLIRVPVHAQETALKLLAMQRILEVGAAPGAPPPTDAQLALGLGLPEATVSLYRKAVLRRGVESLDDPINSQSGVNMEGQMRIGGERWPWSGGGGEIPRLTELRLIQKDILRVMRECLSPAEVRVLRLRFGMEAGEGEEVAVGGEAVRTFKEIGRIMELSGEAIRRVAGRAVRKLQASDEANALLLAYASSLL